MLKAPRTHVLLLLIFTFSFVYRMLLMLWDGFPPGADIGLHNSVIYSITGSGNTDFLYNFYHIGGGISLTFPGYHIFTAGVMMLTGLPEYIAHAAVVSLFSSLIVLCAFLITKRVWSISAAYIVAFLAAISRFDIEMLLWAGYPNVITLLLIPLTFYLYLQKDRFSTVPFLVSTSILVGSMFLTHSLSAGIYGAIAAATVLFVLISPKTFGASRKTALYWFLPIIFGAILVAPFLMQAIPAYLSQNATLSGFGGNDIEQATLSTRVLPLWMVLPLFGAVAAFFVFSKKYYKRFFALPAFLLAMWIFVPLAMTQGYLVGFVIDYNRFLYFLILPVLVFMAVLIDHGSGFFAKIVDNYRTFSHQAQSTEKTVHRKLSRISAALTRKRIYSIFVLFFLLFSFGFLPVFMTPSMNVGQSIQSFYQTMNNKGWEAIQWTKQSTPEDSVFVADALYGWWLGGFAQRRTLSAVDPQYLSLSREFAPAQFARNLLDTDFLVDNGLVQVREDGYLARHNPEVLANLNWTYFPYSFFNFGSDKIRIEYRVNGDLEATTIDQLGVRDMHMENDSQHATITVVRGNDYFNYTQITTVYRGQRFVNLTTTIDSVSGVSLDWVHLNVASKGTQVPYNNNKTVGLVDVGVKTFGQLIFSVPPYSHSVSEEGATAVQLDYNLEGKSEGGFEISAAAYSAANDPGIYSVPETMYSYFIGVMASNMQAQTPIDVDFKQVFNYRLDTQVNGVSYVVCREAEMQPKFARDPLFSLVFINEEVAIFKVNGNLS